MMVIPAGERTQGVLPTCGRLASLFLPGWSRERIVLRSGPAPFFSLIHARRPKTGQRPLPLRGLTQTRQWGFESLRVCHATLA